MTAAPKLVREQPEPPPYSEDALALAFAEVHGERLRYVAAWGRWLIWNGSRWRPDTTLHAYDLVRSLCREVAGQVNGQGEAKKVASAATVAAVEKLARADRRIAATVEQWDADPWLLNTPRGVLDLRTGRLRPPEPTDYCLKQTAVAPEGDCPQWLAFLDRIMRGDREMIAFLQRVCGYCLTGSIAEHAMFFLYGTGANGKSVLLATVAGILGDYSTSAMIETFVASQFDRHPTELASLAGARLVSATETEEGRTWAEARIKAVTGGEPISARYMRRDPFDFIPNFKLVVSGNHRPQIRNVDEAMRRRMNLIPFMVTIPPEERDPELPEKLKAEWPGILQWMVEGCIDLQESGLRPPESVRDATAEYLEAEDSVTLWIEQCCKVGGDTYFSPSGELWKSWRDWAHEAGEPVGSQKKLSEALKNRGFRPRKSAKGVRGFEGIFVKPDAPAWDEP